MKTPLHLKPWDQSFDARAARAEHAQQMLFLNPQGFRQPSSKTNYDHGTTFVEDRCVAAGLTDPISKERSERSERGKKRKQRRELIAFSIKNNERHTWSNRKRADFNWERRAKQAKAGRFVVP